MCGIAGIFGRSNDRVVNEMIDGIAFRGPDGRDVVSGNNFSLGACRLSLLDIENGSQPMQLGARVLAFNGEIYNHADLKRSLEKSGVKFSGYSDTEVILRGFDLRGIEFFDELDGMYAIAICSESELILARDPVGMKPLYYAFAGGDRSLAFGSEVKAVLRDPNVSRNVDVQSALEFSLINVPLGFPLDDRTFFHGVRQVEPGGRLIFAQTEEGPKQSAKWRATFDPPDAGAELFDEAHVENALETILSDSVAAHLASDHPIGVFLSGGVDSSLLAGLAAKHSDRKVMAFGAYADEAQPDIQFARRAAEMLELEFVAVPISKEDYSASFAAFICHQELPMAPSTAFMTGKAIRQHVKAILCGDGADELFAGYPIFLNKPEPILLGVRGANRLRHIRQESPYAFGDCSQIENILEKFTNFDCPQRIPFIYEFLFNERLPKVHMNVWDRGTMAHGLETRLPYLSNDLVEFGLALPWEFKVRSNEPKVVLRALLRRYFDDPLCTEIRTRRKLAAPAVNSELRRQFFSELRANVPEEYLAAHPLNRVLNSWVDMVLFDAFMFLFIVHGGVPPDEFDIRSMHRDHLSELEAISHECIVARQ